jgi:hypothetical protein
MTNVRAVSKLRLALLACVALGCDEQYASPDTVALVITDDASNTQRVNRCHYVPILLGSRVSARYRVDAQLQASIDVTREQVTVFFEGGDSPSEPFELPASRFEGEAREIDPAPPSGYSVELRSPCAPDDL